MDAIRAFIEWASSQIELILASTTYLGVVFLMAIESCNIPLPSELILTFAGYLVADGKMNVHGAALAGAIGCVVGSLPSYYAGLIGGRPFLHQYGKWLLLTPQDLVDAERWVAKYGDWTFFICRMLPVIRTFISLPAGILKARFWPFVVFTFVGSWVWSYFLVYVGMVIGENKDVFRHYWHQFDALIIGVCTVLGVIYVYKHIKRFKKANGESLGIESNSVSVK